LHPWCKSCRRTEAAARYAANRDRILAVCRAWREANPEKCKERNAKYRRGPHADEQRARVRIASARWRESDAGKIALKRYAEKDKAGGFARKAKWRREHPDRCLVYVKRWQAKHPERVTEISAKKRAVRRSATIGDRKALSLFYKKARTVEEIPCYWCRDMTAPGWRHVDHIIPLSRGGAHSIENLAVSCAPCNRQKHCKLPNEFMKTRGIAS
jgi:5-methylcytosine-specific restriction endonuclease McrA